MQKVAQLGTIQQGKVQFEPESWLVSLSVALVTTLVCFTIANIVFDQVASGFTRWRQIRTEFAFRPPSHHMLLIVFLICGGTVAIRCRQWIVPIGLALILGIFSQDVHAYSGPGYLFRAVQPLIELNSILTGAALHANSVVLIALVVVSKDRAVPKVKPVQEVFA